MAGAHRRSLARRVAAAVAILVLVAIGAIVALAALRPQVIVRQVEQVALPAASRAIGRQLTVGRVEAGLFPPRAELRDVAIAGRSGEPPLVRVGSARARVRLWPLLKSLGQDVQLESVALDRPVVNLIRGRDGRWSYEGLGQGAPSDRRVWISRLEVRGGEVHVRDARGGAGAETIALRQMDVAAKDLGGGAPAHVELKASLASAGQDVKATLDQAGAGWTGSLDAQGLDLRRLRGLLPAGLDATLTGGQVTAHGRFELPADRPMRIEGSVQAPSLLLRGQPASGGFSYVATIPQGAPQRATVQLSAIQIRGPGVDLAGQASLSASPPKASFELSGPLLDLDTLLAALPPSPPSPPSAEPLPEPMRRALKRVAVTGRLAVERVVVKRLVAERVAADVRLADGVVRLSEASGLLYGGTLDAAGTRLDLTQARPSWDLSADLRQLDLGQAMQLVSGAAPLRGRLTGRIRLSGSGDLWEQLRTTLTGTGAFELHEGELTTASLEQSLAGPLAEAARIVGKGTGLARGGTGAAASTSLHDLAGSFTLADGFLKFSRPLKVRTPAGEVTLGGALGLDQRLDLTGSVRLSPEFVQRTVGLRPARPIDAPLAIGGSLLAPAIRTRPEDLARSLALQAVPAPEDLLRKGLKGLFPRP